MRVCVLILIHTRIHMYSVLCALILFQLSFPLILHWALLLILISFIVFPLCRCLCACVRMRVCVFHVPCAMCHALCKHLDNFLFVCTDGYGTIKHVFRFFSSDLFMRALRSQLSRHCPIFPPKRYEFFKAQCADFFSPPTYHLPPTILPPSITRHPILHYS